MATAFWPPNPNPLTATVSTFACARDERHVVEVALRVGRVQVGRRRDHLVADAAEGGERADAMPAAPTRCPIIDLGELIGTRLEAGRP